MSPHELVGAAGLVSTLGVLAREGARTLRTWRRSRVQLARIENATEKLDATAARVDELTVQHEDCERRNAECEATSARLAARAAALAIQNAHQETRLVALEVTDGERARREMSMAAELAQFKRQALGQLPK